jgi:hypothetical protein
MCVGIFNDFDMCLNSRRWFMLCLVYIPNLVLLLVSGDRDSLRWVQLSRFQIKTETESILRKVVSLNKNRMMENVPKHNNCTISEFCMEGLRNTTKPKTTIAGVPAEVRTVPRQNDSLKASCLEQPV